jgi:glutamate-1-semialdehyde 2,1-aminomutase
MYAMRLARAHTGREKILKFEGGYHGMSGEALMSLVPRRLENFPRAISDSAGIPEAVRNSVLVAPFNDAAFARQLIAEYADEIAGVIVEPFQRLIPPETGFLEALREATTEHGIVLIFDEVVTGFRLAYGGAQERYGVTPDLCTLGKVIGGGFPLAAIAGRAELMAHFDKTKVGADGFTFQVGTLSGNPVAAVAGLKTLEILRRPGSYEGMRETGRAIMAALEANLARVGVPARVIGDPMVFDAVFTDQPVVDYRGTLRGDADRLQRFNMALRARGVLKNRNKFYIALAHDAADIADTREAIEFAADFLVDVPGRGGG